jgi:subfamily B ATP-binding cassette protein MsbA
MSIKAFLLKRILKNQELQNDASIGIYFKRFYQDFMWKNKYSIIIALIFMAIYAAANAGMAYLVKPIVNNVFAVKDLMEVYKIGFSLMGVTFVKTGSQYIYMLILSSVAIKVIADARNKLYQSFLKQDLSFFYKNSPGRLMSVMMNEINAINTLATEVPINIGRDLFTFIGLVVVMFIQEPVYAIFIMFSIVFIVIPIALVGKKIKKIFGKTNAGFGDLTVHIEQSLHAIKEVKSYAMEEKEINNTVSIINIISKMQQKLRKVTALLPSLMELLGGITVAFVLMYGSYRVVHYGADSGSFFSFIAALLIAYQPLKRLTEFTTKIQLGLLGIKRYYSFIDTKPEIIDLPNAQNIKVASANLVFKNVSFSYNKEQKVLENINFEINKGQKVALVGRSGGGKTTIMNLIPRFYDVETGSIEINGTNIKDFTISSLRQNISLVSQEVIVFDTTLYNNIKYGREDATHDEIIEAARKASCLDFIEAMPEKFETLVGPRGMRLSGGQKQRISIARALLKNAPILLLDEATSALDTESEKAIQSALNILMKDKTTVIIAHRLSTIVNCDNIFVVDKGQIIEQGNNQELLAKNGFYKYLYDLQFKDV